MFNNSSKIDYSLNEGTVTEVDVLRKLCKVKTLSGQNLSGVHWLQPKGGSSRGDDSTTPELGDRAVINTGLGYPLIIGYLPRVRATDNSFPVNINEDENLIDTGSFSPASDAVSFSQNAPKDRALGDRIFTSSGGGILGILRGGSLLLRSSRLSEIFLCKWDDVVRIVSRNYEHYTDLSSDFIRNLKGRVYRYTGYAKTQGDAKTENYSYNEYYGDVAMGERAKTDLGSNLNPVEDGRIYKEEITQGRNGAQLMYREIYLDGTHDLRIVSPDGSLITQIKSRNNDILVTSRASDGSLFSEALFTKSNLNILVSDSGSIFTKANFTKDEVKVTYKDTNVVKINDTQINLDYKGESITNMSAEGIKSTFGQGVVDINNEGVHCTFEGHFMRVTSAGVALG